MEEKLSDTEKNMLKVIKAGLDESKSISLSDDLSTLNNHIEETEKLLRSLGYGSALVNIPNAETAALTQAVVVRTFDDLLKEADEKYPAELSFSDIFTPQEIAENRGYIKALNEEFNSIHRLDKIDIMIPATLMSSPRQKISQLF